MGALSLKLRKDKLKFPPRHCFAPFLERPNYKALQSQHQCIRLLSSLFPSLVGSEGPRRSFRLVFGLSAVGFSVNRFSMTLVHRVGITSCRISDMTPYTGPLRWAFLTWISEFSTGCLSMSAHHVQPELALNAETSKEE
jgi:hypothetical protein